MLGFGRQCQLLTGAVVRPVRELIAAAAILAAVVALADRAGADVLLIGGHSVRANVLPPLIPLPNGAVVAASNVVLSSWYVTYSDDDVLVYDPGSRVLSRYGTEGGLPLDMLERAFSGSIMIIDPKALTVAPLNSQSLPLQGLLAQAGFVAVIDLGAATVPPSILSIRADDVHPPTPPPTAPPQPTRTPGPCLGDCNGDGFVAVDELLRGLHISLEIASIGTCPAFDVHGDGTANVTDLVTAISFALYGCP